MDAVDLERRLKSAEARAAELQAWVDDAEAESEKLRARVAELEGASTFIGSSASLISLSPSPPAGERVGERGDAAEVTRLKAQVAELQSWADASDAENEKLRAQLTPSSSPSDITRLNAKIAELQSWADASDAENARLHSRLEQLVAASSSSITRAPDTDAATLRARITELETAAGAYRGSSESRLAEMKAWADDSDAENAKLLEKISTLEATNHKLQHMASQFAESLEASAHDNVKHLEAQLSATEDPARVAELEASLSNAREAIATLELERTTALDQVRRYVQSDSLAVTKNQRDTETAHHRELEERDRHAANLEAQLAEKVDEVSVLQVRVKAYVAQEQKLQDDVAAQRQRACVAEEKLGHGQAELEMLREDKAALEARALELGRKLEETQRWMASGELESSQLQRELEAARTELAVMRGADAPKASASSAANGPPPPPADAGVEGNDLEGFSVQRLHRLEALLAAEKIKSDGLARLVATIEKSLVVLTDEVEAARGKLADLRQKLGLSDSETGEALDRLDAARRELHALKAELARPPDATPANDDAPLNDADVLEAPMEELSGLAEQQAQVAREATDALAGEQRAREQLVGDLHWLKAELEKLSHVRDDLRQRIHAMVQRELRRKTTVGALLDKLRSTEVAAAARAGSLRRLQLAMELAQRTAVKVQTTWFQKQIGSLQRQLESALKAKPGKPTLKLAR